jgi:hypothetical protein
MLHSFATSWATSHAFFTKDLIGPFVFAGAAIAVNNILLDVLIEAVKVLFYITGFVKIEKMLFNLKGHFYHFGTVSNPGSALLKYLCDRAAVPGGGFQL